MKKLLLFLPIILFFTSCSNVGFVKRSIDKHGYAYLLRDNPELLTITNDGRLGVPAGINFEGKTMDKIKYSGYRYSLSSKWFKVSYNNQEYYLQSAIDEIDYDILTLELPVEIEPEEDKYAWSRAVVYISKYGSLKIQTQTDLIIETFTPTETGDVGFRVAKEIKKDKVLYHPLGVAKSDMFSISENMEFHFNSDYYESRKLAYFMLYGKETVLKNFDYYYNQLQRIGEIKLNFDKYY